MLDDGQFFISYGCSYEQHDICKRDYVQWFPDGSPERRVTCACACHESEREEPRDDDAAGYVAA